MPELMNTIMADGPSSNPSQPLKAQMRAWGTWVEGIITAFLSSGGLIYDTKAHLDVDLAHAANSMAWVLGDATVANNGIYRKLGASGAGSWTRIADLPYSYIQATDAGAGTPNAIVATSSIPLPTADAGALIAFSVFEANTASPVTVAFNGGAALTIKTSSGNNIAAGGLTAGMVVAGYKSGSAFRLISDQASSAIQAAAEAAASAAAAFAAAAAASAALASASRALKVTAIQSAPPGAPASGDTYIMGAAPSGSWSGFAKDQIAIWDGANWTARPPVDGELANVGTGPAVEYSYDVANTKWIAHAPRGSQSWLQGKGPAIISRGTPKFLMPEMYIGLETQLIYCPAEDPNDYSGATNFAPAVAAMRDEMLTLLGPAGWFPSGRQKAPFGVAFQPGHRYALDSGAKFCNLMAKGLVIKGYGATLCGRYDGGAPLLDMIGSHGIYVSELHGESNNDAQPSFGVAIGRRSLNVDASDMHFDSCRWAGWWKKAGVYNGASEVFRWHGGESLSMGLAANALHLDSRNIYGMGAYTQAADYDYGAGVDASAVSHWITHTNMRCLSGCDTGAVRITSSETETELNQVSGIVIEAYMTNSAKAGSYTKAPAVQVEGVVKSLCVRGHSEARISDANIDLSHLVYYVRGNGAAPLVQFDHRIEDYFCDAELSVIGANAHAFPMYLEACHIVIGYQRGDYPSGTTAKLFDGANMANVRWTGSLSVRDLPASFINLNALEYCDIDLVGGFVKADVGVPVSSRVNMRTVRGVNVGGGGQKKAVLTVTANGTYDANGYDIIAVSGAATAITLSGATSFYGSLEVINTTIANITVSGLESGPMVVPAGRALPIVQHTTKWYAATAGSYTGVYSPTPVGVANVDSAVLTDSDLRYTVVGAHVRVSGRLTIDPTAAANTVTTVRLPLPIASNLIDGSDLSGSIANASGLTVGSITADAANDAAQINFLAGSTAAIGHVIDFEYQIK